METQELLQDYVAEVQEHLLNMEESLLLLEQEDTGQEQIAQVFRAAHSIKGASACMGFEGLTTLTHELESLISAVQSSARSVPSAGISLLLECVDLIARAVDHVKKEGSEPPFDPSLLENLRSAFFVDAIASADFVQEVSIDQPGNVLEIQANIDDQAALCSHEEQQLQATIEEEDEELLTIFVNAFRENYLELLRLLKSSPKAEIDDKDKEAALGLVEKLVSAARYMDYLPIVAQLEEWGKNLDVRNGAGTGRQEMLERLAACAATLGRMIPQLELPSNAEPGPVITESPIEEDDRELFSIFLDSFQQNFSRLAEVISSPEPAKVSFDRASELTDSLIQSSKYMDYTQLVELLEEWNDLLSAFKDLNASDLGPLREYLATVGEKVQCLLSGLELPESIRQKPEGSLAISLDDEIDFIFGAEVEPDQPALPIEKPRVSDGPVPGEHTQESPVFARPAKDLGAHTGEEECTALITEDSPQNAAAMRVDAQEEEAQPLNQAEELVVNRSESTGQKPEGSPAISLDDEIDFIFDAEVKPGQPAPPIAKPRVSDGPVSGEHTQASPVFARPFKEPGAHTGGKERTVLITEDSPQNAATMRVDAQKVDQLLNQVGELVVNRSEFIQTATLLRDVVRDLATEGILPKHELRRLRLLDFSLNESTQSLGRIANDLQTSVMRVRMLPISQLFQRFPRIVRDQALKLGKRVELIIEGGETEIDKRVLEQMNDPLVQFLRNAIAHGIETPEERKRSGKPETGSIRLAAYHAGDYVAIDIEDDGRGIDTQKLRELLLNRNAVGQHELDRLTDTEIAYSIFMPGISTYEKVDGAAGRGVGLDVVKQNVEHMNGTIEVTSSPGQGARFLIRIPLTVAIIRALLVREEEQVFTLPLTSVTEILRHRPEDTYSIEGFKVITLRGKTIPLVDLGELLNVPGHQTNGRHRFVVIVNTSFRDVGLVVDGLMGEREVVIKSIENNFHPVEGFSGATILGDGRVSLIVDVSALLRMMKNSSAVPFANGGQQYVN